MHVVISFFFKKLGLKMFINWQPFSAGLNVLKMVYGKFYNGDKKKL